jgi:hypothetical protein
MTALPSIWRALQCLRLYWDTGKNVPALPNCAKYVVTIVLYATLSVYRIDQTITNRCILITVGAIQGIYTSFWDMYYDWNLGDLNCDRQFLRQTLAYRRVWIYHTAIVLNPVLRFSWILYVLYSLQLQHVELISFGISIGEVLRRGLWSLLRVESEHCTHSSRDANCTSSIAGQQSLVGTDKGLQQPASASEDSDRSVLTALPLRPARTYHASNSSHNWVLRYLDIRHSCERTPHSTSQA